MTRRVVDVDLENLHMVPKECLDAVYWELTDLDPGVDPRFEKEEWFSSTLLEWGSCGKLLLEDEWSAAFAQYAPGTLFPRLASFAAGRVSDDALYLAYCYVVEGHRGRGLGTDMIREVARNAVDRGYRALETIGDREWAGDWVLPVSFLAANGFTVLLDDARYPLLRLDLHETRDRLVSLEAAALPLGVN